MTTELRLLLAISFLAAAAPAQDNFHLKDGDRVVFFGDSITQQRLYTTFVETYAITRFPKRNVVFVHSGWGGDRVTGGGGGGMAGGVPDPPRRLRKNPRTSSPIRIQPRSPFASSMRKTPLGPDASCAANAASASPGKQITPSPVVVEKLIDTEPVEPSPLSETESPSVVPVSHTSVRPSQTYPPACVPRLTTAIR